MKKNGIYRLYETLLQRHGKQGWWPVRTEWGSPGYHPMDESLPRTRLGRFEVCVGAILTQNTAWTNVEKVLEILDAEDAIDPDAILHSDDSIVQDWIRSAGYYRMKATYMKAISNWFLGHDLEIAGMSVEDSRKSLLAVRGVGPETADTILLYAYGKLTFVIDTYTKRILSREKLSAEGDRYEFLRRMMMESLPADVFLYQDFHALIVAEEKSIRTI